MTGRTVDVAYTDIKDSRQAAEALASKLARDDTSLTIVFCDRGYHLPTLTRVLRSRLSGPIVGCTSAGEIAPGLGYVEGGAVAVSITSSDIAAHAVVIPSLDTLTAERAQAATATLHERRRLDNSRCFSLLLVDGMSMREEITTALLHDAVEAPVIGGSAGDGMQFETTWVFHNEDVQTNAAVLCLVESRLPFKVFQTHHLEPTSERLVITRAQPSRRRVMEIDGVRAADAYAELVGVAVDELSPEVFSQNPVMLRLGGEFYVRSIQRVEEDGSLIFYCAIDEGLVLTLGQGGDLVEGLRQTLADIEDAIGPPHLILACDCILRRLEMVERDLCNRVNEVLQGMPFVGFSSYGEQIGGVHVNQTLTGIALGPGRS